MTSLPWQCGLYCLGRTDRRRAVPTHAINNHYYPRSITNYQVGLVRASTSAVGAYPSPAGLGPKSVLTRPPRPRGEAAPLFCDLFDRSSNTLYESKATVTRAAVRIAIGQLADYGRMVTPTPRRAVLVPERPRDDLLALAHGQGIDVVWPERGAFDREDGSVAHAERD
jgi:hypothetical protein